MIAPICKHCKAQPASGVWEVTTRREVYAMVLCASCGLTKIGNRVRMFEDESRGEMVFYKDVERVELLVSFSRPNVPLAVGGLKAETPDVATPPLDEVSRIVCEYRAKHGRTPPAIHPSVLNRVDWSYR